jgi:Zn-dependent alcohol dehydrogenase
MRISAGVLRQAGRPLEIEKLELEPRRGARAAARVRDLPQRRLADRRQMAGGPPDGARTRRRGHEACGGVGLAAVLGARLVSHDLLGTHVGGATPALDIPALAALMAAGLLDLAPLATHRYRLEEVGEALETTRSGTSGRVVLDVG